MNTLKKLQAIFQTLSDVNRLTILQSIGDRECAVGELVKTTGLSQPLVSHHLRVLKEKSFLETKRKGPFIFYYLRDTNILHAIDLFVQMFKDTEFKTVDPGFRFCSERMMKNFKNFKY